MCCMLLQVKLFRTHSLCCHPTVAPQIPSCAGLSEHGCQLGWEFREQAHCQPGPATVMVVIAQAWEPHCVCFMSVKGRQPSVMHGEGWVAGWAEPAACCCHVLTGPKDMQLAAVGARRGGQTKVAAAGAVSGCCVECCFEGVGKGPAV